MRSFRGIFVVSAMSLALWGAVPATAHAAPKTMTVIAQVVDESGQPHRSSAAIACPVRAGEPDCSHPVRAEANRAGFATLKLDADVRYAVFGVVHDPQPAWACPGVVIDGQESYLSDPIEALGRDVPRMVTFTVAQPPPLDCVVVTVTDDAGNDLLSKANLVVCAHVPASTDCIGDDLEFPDADGVIRMKIDPALVYDLMGVASHTGWVCPSFVLGDGTELWFSANDSYTADQLLAGVVLAVHQPVPENCKAIAIVDDSGNPLIGVQRVLSVCGHLPGSTECLVGPWDGPDADGVTRIEINRDLVYDLNVLVFNSGWPCPNATSPDGTLHLGIPGSFAAADFDAGVTLTVHHPSEAECAPPPVPNAVVSVVDDSTGDPLTGAGLFVCAHAPGSSECVGDRFEGPDPDGVIRMVVDDTLEYDLGAFITNTGWPCPWVNPDDGTEFHFGPNGTYTASELVAGVTLTIHHPSEAECAPPPTPNAVVSVVDDSTGDALTGAGLFVCAHAPGSSECVGDRFEGPDPDGVIRMVVDDTLEYDLGTFITDTGWPCPGFISDDGTEFHFGAFPNNTTYTAAQLIAGVTLSIHHPTEAECAPPPVPNAVVSVVDDSTGDPLTGAGLFVCAHAPGSSECVGDRFEGPDPDGVIRMVVDDALEYDLGTFITNTGWPCPWINPDDGTEFHFGAFPNNTTYTAAELIAGVTLTIHHPTEAECPG